MNPHAHIVRKTLCLLFGVALGLTHQALAQSGPIPLPQTLSTVVGGAASLCQSAYDSVGDGCPAGQAVVGVSAPGSSAAGDVQGLAIDAYGNLIFADTGNGLIRKVNRRTGIVSLVAGSTIGSAKVCAAATDKYGDGCPASDGAGNQNGGYTGNFSSPKGIAVGPNGDIYIAGYGVSLIQKVSASTGLLTVVAGSTSPAGAKGSSVKGYTGDAGPATAATLNAPRGVAIDSAGNVYIADTGNNVVRRVNAASGVITTIAGSTSGTAGSTGDGAAATFALLNQPGGVAVDTAGNVYIADTSNKRIRVIYEGGSIPGISAPVVGYIYTIAGGGTTAYTANNDVPATSIGLSIPRMLTVDAAGNVFIADSGKNVVWFLDAGTDYMRPIAGTYGSSAPPATGCTTQTDNLGDGCSGLLGGIYVGSSGLAVAVDAQENLYVTDPLDQRVREVSSNTIFGSQTVGASNTQLLTVHFSKASSGPAVTNPFAVQGGNSDFSVGSSSCTINADATVDCGVTVGFTPSLVGFDGARLTATSLLATTTQVGISGLGVAPQLLLTPGLLNSSGFSVSTPSALAIDAVGTVYTADSGSNRIFVYPSGSSSPSRTIGTGAAGYQGDGGDAAAASINNPKSVAVDAAGNLFIADSGNNVIRRVDAVTNVITTFAGGATASLLCPTASNSLGDGCAANKAMLSNPTGVAVDSFGVLYITDAGHQVVRAVSPSGFINTVAGGATTVCAAATDASGDGCPLTQAIFNAPSQLLVERSGDLLLADTGNHLVRRASLSLGTVSAVAGTGSGGDLGDGGVATSAQLNHPVGVSEDAAGNVYIADRDNDAIRLVSAGTLTTIAGQLGTSGKATLPISADEVLLSAPTGLAIAPNGGIYIADSANGRVLIDQRTQGSVAFGSVNVGASSAVRSIQLINAGNSPTTLGSPLFTTAGNTGVFQLAAAATNGCVASQSLASAASCGLSATFTPTGSGAATASYASTASSPASVTTPQITLTGTGVVLVTTTTSLSLTQPSGRNPEYGESITLSVTVSPTTSGGTPGGTVRLQVDGGTPMTTALTGGSATIVLQPLTVGNHSVTATYSGDSVYASSNATALTLTVTKAPVTVALTVNPTTPTVQFQTVTLTATVSSTTTGAPTGTVTFTPGAQNLGSSNLANGVATLITTALPVGTNTVVAAYNGDGNFQALSSPGTAVTVNPQPPDYTVSLANQTLTVAQGGTIQTTLTVTPSNTLVGRVSFACTGLPSNSVCTFAPAYQNFDLSSDVPAQVTLTVWTNVDGNNLTWSVQDRFVTHGVQYACLLLGALPVLFFTRRRKAWGISSLAIVVASIFALTAAGCSGGTTNATTTPAGTSTLVITASGPAAQSHSTSLALTVTAAH